jgi:hypothetical protein
MGSRYGDEPWPRDGAVELIETNWLLIFPIAAHSFVFALPARKV